MTIVTLQSGDLLYRFGPFLADPTLGRLYCLETEVPLTPKSFKVLMVLVERGDERVDKEELFERVWPDTFVEQNNLARNISMVRKALHEHDAKEEYIVTVPGRGYRFVAPVARLTRAEATGRQAASEEVVPTNTGQADADVMRDRAIATSPPLLTELSVPATGRAGWRSITVAASVALALVGAAIPWLMRAPVARFDQSPERNLWQLTSTGRLEGEPTWSPDGQRVAYSSDRSGNFDIWVQPVSAGSPIRITSEAARDWQPSWSPDGHNVAFRSERDGGGLFVVPADGGSERRISTFGFEPQWSPNGAAILFWDSGHAYTIGLDEKAPSKVGDDVVSRFPGGFHLAWHPDGRRISIYGSDGGQSATLWTVPVHGGPAVRSSIASAVAQRLRAADLRLGSFVWAPAADMLYFEGRSGQTENLWRIRVDPQTLEWVSGPERLTTGSSLESGVALSPDGKRLAFGSRVESTVAWSLPFNPVSGRIMGPGEPITPDGANAEILDISPDGRQLAYRVNGLNRHELWIRSVALRADRLRTVEADAAIVQPRWSRDGTQLAYLRRPSNRMRDASIVLLAANDTAGQRVLPAAHSPEMVYDWSGDGQSLLVRCRAHTPRWAICQLPNASASGPAPDMRVVAADAKRNLYAAKNSPDERWVSFIAAPDPTRSTVYVSPAEGGRWVAMTEGRYFEDKPRWSPDGRTLYFLSNRTGFWNLWGRGFDSRDGIPVGEPFQVSHFDTSVQMIRNLSDLQIAITQDRLILPITQSSGVIWVLENVHR
jgi:Tol biopolymer transport system component/DNA-binding winged helix-turn-helix (wHTH) protein